MHSHLQKMKHSHISAPIEMLGERKIVTLLVKSGVNVNRPYAQRVVLEKVSITPELEAAHDMGSTSKIGERDQVIEGKISSNDIDNIISELLKIKLDETIKYSKGEVRERPQAEYKSNLILKAKEIEYKKA